MSHCNKGFKELPPRPQRVTDGDPSVILPATSTPHPSQSIDKAPPPKVDQTQATDDLDSKKSTANDVMETSCQMVDLAIRLVFCIIS